MLNTFKNSIFTLKNGSFYLKKEPFLMPFGQYIQALFYSKKFTCYTLNKKCITSPSLTT